MWVWGGQESSMTCAQAPCAFEPLDMHAHVPGLDDTIEKCD